MLETFGRYQLLKKLATGGMGQVFLARQKGPVGFEKMVVVKRILPHLSEEEEFIQMFYDEARIAAHLNHPNIAQIFDLGEVDGVYYMAMEYVHGESLREVNNKANAEKGGLPFHFKCRIIADAAAGLDFAHRAVSPSGEPLNLIHRDVSPQNILIGFSGGVKLIDFGVAKAAGKISHTKTGAIKGKYAYMSPEQARGDELDHRSDIFGLGICFYEILTNSRLFKRDSETATLKAVVGAKIHPPSSLLRGLPKPLDFIVLKALARKPQDRFQTAGEFQMALEEFMAKQRLVANAAHLAAFMHELYGDQRIPERFAADASASTGPAAGKQRSGSEPRPLLGAPPKSDSRSRTAPVPAPRLAARSRSDPRRGGHQATVSSSSPSQAPVSRSGSYERDRPLVIAEPGRGSLPDPEDLKARLDAVRPSDSVQGAFFAALVRAARGRAGLAAEPKLRAVAPDLPRTYDEGASYPADLFLKVLWRAADLLAPHCESADRAFFELGGACMDALLSSPAGRTLQEESEDLGAQWLFGPLLAAMEPMSTAGERRVDASSARGATLTFRADLLPPPFHAGMLHRAMSLLKGVPTSVNYEPRGIDAVVYRVQW